VRYTIKYKVDLIVKNSGLYEQLDSIAEEIGRYTEKISNLNANLYIDKDFRKLQLNKIVPILRGLRQQRAHIETAIDQLRVSSTRQVILDAEIIVSTLGSSGSALFTDLIAVDDISFDTVIIDEAGQTTEPSTLIPLRYGCRNLVLVGDPRQLAATGKHLLLDTII
jgi:senataxin